MKLSRVFVGIIILVSVIAMCINIFQDLRYLKMLHGFEPSLFQFLKMIFLSNYFVRPILIILSIIGFFYLAYGGWLTISNLFYFVLFEQILIRIPEHSNELLYYIVMVIPMIILVVLNLKSILDIYGIKKKDVLVLNMTSIIIAMTLILVKGHLLLNNKMLTWEIIDKVK